MPLAVAVGVLRYDLLGLDAVVRRTLLYGALTALVLAVFVAVTAALTAVLPRGRTPEVVAASLIAVGLVPARERLQTLVDRLVYGDRADPWSALHRLGTPVGGVADDALLPAVVGALSEGLRVPAVAVWRADGTTVATSGEAPPASLQHPLVLAGARLGTLVVAPRRGEDRLSSADLRLVAAVAPLVAVLLHTTQLTSELRAERARVVNATASERERLRQELHDGLGPSLTGVGMGLEALQRRVRADDAVAADLVSRLRTEVAGAVEEVRRILAALRPGVLDEVGLVGALERRADQLTATTGLVVDVVVPVPVVGVPAAVEAAVLRTAEEALANVVRHAGATRCRVEVRVERGAVQLAVTDDGTGLPVQREGGVGLSSMRARAEGLGGTFTARQDGGGTQVRAELPLAVTA